MWNGIYNTVHCLYFSDVQCSNLVKQKISKTDKFVIKDSIKWVFPHAIDRVENPILVYINAINTCETEMHEVIVQFKFKTVY